MSRRGGAIANQHVRIARDAVHVRDERSEQTLAEASSSSGWRSKGREVMDPEESKEI